MGVPGLETFLKKEVPNGILPVNILEEICRRKCERPEEPIVLVFQVVDLLYNIYMRLSTPEIICGPAFRKIHEIFDVSLQNIRNSGVDLHFFANEPAYHRDLKVWSVKESELYSTRIKLMDQFDSNAAFEEVDLKGKYPGATAAMNDLLAMCEKYGTVHLCLSSTYIADVVKYANEKNAMAIVGNNSNFLIFNGNWRYWSCRDIGLMDRSWNTLEFNRSALLKHIGLTPLQMPMLATVAGNDFVTYNKFLVNKKRNAGNIFLVFAEYVKQIPNVLTIDDQRKLLLDLFGSYQPKNFEMVRDSLLFYTTRTEQIQQMDSLLTSAASVSAVYYSSLTESPIRVKAPSLYDLRRTDFLPYSEIILPILRRQIGFVRKHKNDNEYEQVLELRLTHSGPIRTVRVRPEYPKTEIPDLMYLSFNRNNDYFNSYRFKLLKWMVFGDDIHPQFLIQNIPMGYKVAVITVLYLCKLKQLTSSEADAIFLSIYLIDGNGNCGKDFNIPANISTRDILTSHLYIYVHNVVVKCFLFLGLKDFIDYLSIDGAYFIHWVNKLKAGDSGDNDISLIEHLNSFLRFI